MLFNSFAFLGFFAVLAAVYYALPHRYRWPLLLVASVYFYATFGLSYVVLLAAVTAVTYIAAIEIERSVGPRRRRAIFGGSIVLVVSALLIFKYYDFFVGSFDAALIRIGGENALALFPQFPRLDLVVLVGLSFYTFSCISYLADVNAGRLSAERHFGHFALYVAYFPKLLAGPIERAAPFLEQIRRPVVFSAAGVTLGLQWMLWGLFKKVVIADHLATFVDATYAQPAFAAPADLVLATYFFAFQLYCDFSGYSDMAIGVSLVLGIRLMDNFRRPYLARTTQEFWGKRWHLSLASWFRDYVYIPLGGSRVSRLRTYANVMVVFLVSGLWHGANWSFVLWGGINGFYHVIGDLGARMREAFRRTLRMPEQMGSALGIVLTFHLILVTWVFFRAASIGDALTVLQRVTQSAALLPSLLWTRIQGPEILYSIALIGLLMGIEIIDERRPIWQRLESRPRAVRWAVYYAVIIVLLVLGRWQLQNFVYMQF